MARRRRKQSEVSLVPVIAILGFGLWTAIQKSEWNLAPLAAGLLIVVVAIFVAIFLLDKRKKDRIRLSGIAEVDKMSGLDFEIYLKLLLEKRGYEHVKLTTTYDLGVDLIAKKDGITWAIQAKRYKSTVGLDAVRQVVAAMNHYKCDKAMVITNSYFTSNARAIADSAECLLIDRTMLIELITQQDMSNKNTKPFSSNK